MSTLWARCGALWAGLSVISVCAAGAQTLDDIVEWMPDLVLEETDQTFITHLSMRPDPLGGWIAWDQQLNQVRLYEPDGSLRTWFGREGGGPGEFQGVTSAVRVEDGRLITLDRRGRVTVWDASGSEVQSDFNLGIPRPYGMVAGSGDTVIVAAPPLAPDADETRLLQYVSLTSESVERSSFIMPVTDENIRLFGTIASAPPTKTPNGLIVSLAILDSVWSVSHGSGDAVSVPIPGAVLDGIRADRPTLPDTPALRDWVSRVAFVGQVFPRANSGWVAQVWGFDGDPWQGFIGFDRTGGLEWELHPSPLLVWYDSASGLAYFWDANGLEPGRVKVGRFR